MPAEYDGFYFMFLASPSLKFLNPLLGTVKKITFTCLLGVSGVALTFAFAIVDVNRLLG